MRYFMFGPSNGSIKSLQRGTFLPEQTWKNRTFIPKAISFPSYFPYSLGSVFRQFYLNKSLFGPKLVSPAAWTYTQVSDLCVWLLICYHGNDYNHTSTYFIARWVQVFIKKKIKANSYKMFFFNSLHCFLLIHSKKLNRFPNGTFYIYRKMLKTMWQWW